MTTVPFPGLLGPNLLQSVICPGRVTGSCKLCAQATCQPAPSTPLTPSSCAQVATKLMGSTPRGTEQEGLTVGMTTGKWPVIEVESQATCVPCHLPVFATH